MFAFLKFALSALAFEVADRVCPSMVPASWALRLDLDPARPWWW